MSTWWENSDLWIVAILALAIAGPKLVTMVPTSAISITAMANEDSLSTEAEQADDAPLRVTVASQPVSMCRQSSEANVPGAYQASLRHTCH